MPQRTCPVIPMFNAPFRIAFWTLCCAVTLSLAAAFSNPQANHFVRQLRGASDHDSPLVAVELGEIGPWPARHDSLAEGRTDGETDRRRGDRSLAQAVPIRTASADPAASLGIVQLEAPQAIQEGAHPSLAQSTFTDSAMAEPAVISRPVPTPEGYAERVGPPSPAFPERELGRLRTDLTEVQMTRLERELAELRSSEREKFQQLAQDELTSISRQIQRYRESVGIGDPPIRLAARPDAAAPPPVGGSVQNGAPAGDRILIQPSRSKGGWNIEFRQAELRDVLVSLGRQIGWRIVVDQKVRGTVSSEFRDADPEQVFAITLKARHLRVDRRGDYLLISNR